MLPIAIHEHTCLFIQECCKIPHFNRIGACLTGRPSLLGLKLNEEFMSLDFTPKARCLIT